MGATISPVPGSSPKRAYSREEVCRLLGVRESVLLDWEKRGLLAKLDSYAFRDLVALKTLRELRRSRVRPEKIRLILASLREKLRHVADPLAELKIFTDGRRLAVQVDGRRMEPLTGQLLLDFDQAEIRRLLSFPSERADRTLADELARRKSESNHWFERGVELERTGAASAEVITAYKKAIEFDPESASPFVNLGTVYFQLKQWPEAEKCYRAAIERKADYALAWYNLGSLLDELNDGERALAAYSEALRLQPDYSDAHYNAALLYQARGESLAAVRHWRSYLRLDPSGYWSGIARRELNRLRRETVVGGAKASG